MKSERFMETKCSVNAVCVYFRWLADVWRWQCGSSQGGRHSKTFRWRWDFVLSCTFLPPANRYAFFPMHICMIQIKPELFLSVNNFPSSLALLCYCSPSLMCPEITVWSYHSPSIPYPEITLCSPTTVSIPCPEITLCSPTTVFHYLVLK